MSTNMKLLRCIGLPILLWIGLPSAAHANDQETPPFDLGVTAAYGRVTFFRGSGIEGAGKLRSKDGFAFGISAHYRLHTADPIRFGIHSDLLFVRRGVRYEYQGDDLGSDQLSYLEIPVLVRVRIPPFRPVAPYIVVGPRFGLLLSAESTDANGNVQDESDQTNTLDVGFSAGAGALIQVGSRMMFTIEGRYDQSLMNRLDFDGEEVTNDQRHRAFFLIFGVSMGIKGAAPASADASPAP